MNVALQPREKVTSRIGIRLTERHAAAIEGLQRTSGATASEVIRWLLDVAIERAQANHEKDQGVRPPSTSGDVQ